MWSAGAGHAGSRSPQRTWDRIITDLRAHTPSLKTLGLCHNLIEGIDTCGTATALGAEYALAKSFTAEEVLSRVKGFFFPFVIKRWCA